MSFNRIIITGPECSGKSSLGEYLFQRLSFPMLQETSVQYLDQINRDYEYADLIQIAQIQDELEDNYLLNSSLPIICDTSFLVLFIWSQIKFGKVDTFITDGLNSRKKELFLLCKPDLPWVCGPHRENPADRFGLFDVYLKWLIEHECEFFVVQGTGEKRNSHTLKLLTEKLKIF